MPSRFNTVNVLFLNMPSGYPVKELHASLSGAHDIQKIIILPRKQFTTHDNPLGSIFSRKYRNCIEDEIIKFFPHAEVIEMDFRNFDHRPKVSKSVSSKIQVSVLCSINSYLRVSNKSELSWYWIKIYENLNILSNNIFLWFYDYLRENQNINLFCFNGRFCEELPSIEAAKLNASNYFVYDLKDHKTKTYYIFKNTSLHSFTENCRRAKRYYLKDVKLANSTAKKFMWNKVNGIDTYEKSYTSNQNAKLQPGSKRIISIFPSSDDEYRFLGEEWNGLVVDQLSEIRSFLLNLEKISDYQIIIKMHPNMKTLSKKTLKKYFEFENHFAQVTVMRPNSKINTYDVINKSDLVVVFCSTVGVEANYLRKRVIGIAGSPYFNLPIVNRAKSGSEAAKFFDSMDIKLKSKRASIIWMNYLWKYSDENAFIEYHLGTNKFIKSVKTAKRIGRVLTIPDRIAMIILQSLRGVYPDMSRLVNLKKILKNQ
ncbi:hypothetical protein N9W92_01020 [Planktomarina temperata]|nr:hypothetical protein [Planktomarina temperata]MDB2459786.1 hypothetical protein [Planktomarina temperata]